MANEKRLIDANALDEKLETLKVRFKALGKDAVADDYNFVQTVLLTAPTLDAVEVVHGRWEKPSKYGMNHKFNHLGSVCSRCQKWNDNESNFCPNCGADMRERKDNVQP